MNCPKCGADFRQIYITDSRPSARLGRVRRRRNCEACGHKWTTIEMEATRAGLSIKTPEKHLLETRERIRGAIQELSFLESVVSEAIGDLHPVAESPNESQPQELAATGMTPVKDDAVAAAGRKE